ncbi:MAG TPA: hypothetical protein VHO01_10960 [Jatrophihabitans sp.]|nr:hypothetical protein [Jatrophihabitans sp.]
MWIAAQSFGVSVAFMGDVAVAEDTIADRLGVEGDVVGVLALGYSELRTTRRAAGSEVYDPTHVVWHRAT